MPWLRHGPNPYSHYSHYSHYKKNEGAAVLPVTPS